MQGCLNVSAKKEVHSTVYIKKLVIKMLPYGTNLENIIMNTLYICFSFIPKDRDFCAQVIFRNEQ